MDLFGLRCFVEVVRQGGFSKAAFVLFRTQPAVSQQVRKLEQELGRALLDRSRRAVRLTEAGRALYESARELLERVEGLGGVVADSTAAPSGTLTVASNASLIAHFLPEILKRFHDRHAQVRLKLLNLTSRGIVNAVVEGEAEVGLGFLLKDSPRLESRRVASTELVLVCPPGSARARRRLDSLEAVLEGPLVHFEEGVGLRRHLEEELRGGASLEPALELPTMEAVLTYVRAGLGNSILPEFALAGCRQGELSVRRLSRWLAPIQIRACWRKKLILSRAAEKLLEMLPAR